MKKKNVFVALFVWLAVVASAANDYERLFELRPSASPEEVDAFLREYGVPSKGSVEIEPTAREHGRKFYESFHGLKIDGEYFVVYQRRHLKTEPNTDLYIFKLLCAGRRSATFHIWVSDSEQKNLDEYVHRYKECCVPSAELVSKMEKIPWGTFCRRRKERGGTLDFVNGSLAAFLHITAGVPVDLLPAGKEIDALFRGNAEFLPKDAPELAEVRKSRKDKQDERKRREKIRLAEREREMLFWEYKKLADEGIFPEKLVAAREEIRDDIATFRSAMEKSSGVPVSDSAERYDPTACGKLFRAGAIHLFALWRWEEVRSWDSEIPYHPLAFCFTVLRNCSRNPDSFDFVRLGVEVIHARTLEDARSWAAYFRFKYMAEEERSREAGAEQIARATCVNAFPNLGDENISWRGLMDSSFLPEEKTNETQIIFIRGTSVVSVKSERSDFSALPFARALDALLLGEDEHKAGCLVSPQM